MKLKRQLCLICFLIVHIVLLVIFTELLRMSLRVKMQNSKSFGQYGNILQGLTLQFCAYCKGLFI